MNRHASSLLLLPLLAGLAQAQLPTFSDSSNSISLSQVMAGFPLGTPYHSAVAADLDGNLDPEVVYRVEGGLIVCMNVAVSTSCFRVSIPCNDFVARPTDDGRSELILAGPDGLIVLDFRFDFQAQTVSLIRTDLVDPAVADLRTLSGTALSSANGRDLLGISSDGQSLVALLKDVNAPTGYSIFAPFNPTTQGTAWDVRAIDRDGNNSYEVAAITTAGLEFFGVGGNSIKVYGHTALSGAICELDVGLGQTICWMRPKSATEFELVTADSISSTHQVDLGQVEIVAAATGDLDADGDEDLAVSVKDSSKLLLFEHLGGGSFQGSSPRTVLNGHGSSANNVASPLLSDFDGDGEKDLAWADLNTQTLDIFYNSNWDGFDYLLPQVYYLDFEITNEVTWTFSKYQEYSQRPADATDIQVRVYHQYPDGTTLWDPPQFANPVPIGPFFASTYGHAPKITVPYTHPANPSTDFATYLEARYVVLDGNRKVLKKYPPIFIVFADKTNQGALDYLQSLWGHVQIFIREIGNGEKTGGQSGIPPTGTGGTGGG